MEGLRRSGAAPGWLFQQRPGEGQDAMPACGPAPEQVKEEVILRPFLFGNTLKVTGLVGYGG